MQLEASDLAAIREWASDHAEITEVWLYGSRARGDSHDDSLPAPWWPRRVSYDPS